MIHKIDKLESGSYLLNNTVTITLNENSEKEFLKADYDEKILTEDEVNNMINDFMKMVANQIAISDGVKVKDGASK